ncbi:MAG TPA: hypothetical protein VD903_18840 [Pseudonocardia sp.]|nr:hypothetical protein [Pseudonocardia sp.]
MKVVRALTAAAAALLLAGCAGMQRPAVEEVATTFATGDPATRCALLAPATLAALEYDEAAACTETVAGKAPSGGQVQHVEVWGDQAQVRLGDDTLFLTRSGGGWVVAAAGCTPNGDAPYECRLEGS